MQVQGGSILWSEFCSMSISFYESAIADHRSLAFTPRPTKPLISTIVKTPAKTDVSILGLNRNPALGAYMRPDFIAI